MYRPEKNKGITIAGIIVILAGVFILAGWVFHLNEYIKHLFFFSTIKFNTALCTIMLGAALCTTQSRHENRARIIFALLSVFVLAIGAISFCERLQLFDGHIDELLIKDDRNNTDRPGLMATNASVALTLLALANLFMLIRKKGAIILAQIILHLVALIVLTSAAGLVYGVTLLNSNVVLKSMPVYTSLQLLIIALGGSAMYPQFGVMTLFTGKSVGNRMARALFPPLAVAFFLLSALEIYLERGNIVSGPTNFVMLILSLLLVSLCAIWITAIWLNRVDKQRFMAETRLVEMNETLEKRVEERQSELLGLFAQIKESEEKYRSLIEHASDAIYILDLQDHFIEVNSSMCRMLGYDKEELLKLTIFDMIDKEQLKAEPLYKGLYEPGQAIVRERRFIKKDGSKIDVEVNVKMFSQERVLVIGRDITDRKLMEHELREAETKFRTIAEKSMVGVYIVRDGKFSYVNPRFAGVFGYEPVEMTNTFPIDTIFDEDHKAIANEHVRARMAGEVDSVHYEARCKRKDGVKNWVEFYGSRSIMNDEPWIIGTMIDITERKEAEKILIRSEANLQTILNTTDTAYALFDRQLNVFAYNQKVLQFVQNQYRFTPQKDGKIMDYFPVERFPRFLKDVEEVLKGKSISYEVNYPQLKGDELWYHMRLFPIKNDKEEIFGLMLALYDITPHKAAEYNLKVAYERIQWQVNHIREMNWKQSHLVRSPLANLKGLVDLLKHEPEDSIALTHLLNELDRLDQIIIEMAEDATANWP